TRFSRDWSSDVCSSDLNAAAGPELTGFGYNMFFNPDGTAWTGTDFNQRRGTQGFNAGPLDANPFKSTAIGTISEINDSFYLILRSEERRVGKECKSRWA